MPISGHFTLRRGDLAAWLLSLAAFAALGGLLSVWYRAECEHLLALSKILVKDIGVNLRAVDSALAGIVREHLAGDAAPDQGAVGQRLRALAEAMPAVRGIVVTDRAGMVVAADPPDLNGRDFSQRAYFTAPRERADPALLYLSPPFRSVRGDIAISAARMVPGAGFSGVVSALLDPDYFAGILQAALYAPDMGAAIEHGGGGRFVAAGAAIPAAQDDKVESEGATALDADGVALCRRLKGLDMERDTRIIFVTSYATRSASKPASRPAASTTGAHIWRMAAYARVLAIACGWDEDAADRLELAAPMHDTGKLGIPHTILRKPAPLDEAAWVIMRTHPAIGHAILSQSRAPVFQLAAEVSLRHHERWDGAGYPGGLAGEAIPLAARIVTLADVFDALSMRRPYKDPWPVDKITDYINANSGKQFDPELVRIFHVVLPELLAIKQRWDDENAPAHPAAPGARTEQLC